MKKSTNRAVESFLIVTFPIALFAGCAAEGGKKPETNARMTTQDVTAYTITEDDLDDAAPFTKTPHLLIDTRYVQQANSAIDIEAAENNTTPDMPTAEQLSEEAMTIAWINDTVNTPVAEPVADVSQEITDPLLEVNLKQTETDAMVDIKKPDLDSINFAVNTAEFDAAYLTALQAHAEFLGDNPALTLTVSGHTDSSGSVEYNKMLSKRRALNVYYVLLSYGAPEAQLIMDAFGESSPLNNESRLQENRRVELEYSDSLVLSAR